MSASPNFSRLTDLKFPSYACRLEHVLEEGARSENLDQRETLHACPVLLTVLMGAADPLVQAPMQTEHHLAQLQFLDRHGGRQLPSYTIQKRPLVDVDQQIENSSLTIKSDVSIINGTLQDLPPFEQPITPRRRRYESNKSRVQ